MALVDSSLIGRKREIVFFEERLDGADLGKGSTIVLSGQAGMGKTVLAERFKTLAAEKGFKLFSGSADSQTLRPFHIFSEVFKDIGQETLLRDTEHTGFTKVFAVNKAGMLIADASPVDDDLDSDIFAGMLSAVQSFVKDSFDNSGGQNAGLGRLEYGNLKIITEHGQNLFLTAVISGEEHQNMNNTLRLAVKNIEDTHGHILSNWKGSMEEVEPVAAALNMLVETRFLVRRNLEGVKLDAERLRIADSVLASLSSMAENNKLAIVLEDIHWADESSQFVLEYLARNIFDKNIIILATLRTEEIHEIKSMLDNMKEEDSCQEKVLEKLQKTDILAIVNDRFENHAFGDRFIEQLEGQCEGNPFFIQEILNHMVQEEVISMKDGQYILTRDSYSIPSNVEEIIHRRLDLLEPDAMSIAEYLSCIGREFDPNIPLATELIVNPPEALKKLEDNGIILDGQFSHALFQEVIYNGIKQRWQAAYHQNIGEIIESLYNSDDMIYELARHFSRTRNSMKAFEYCSRAGEKAEVSLAPEQAAEYYEMAIGSLKGMRGNFTEQEVEILTRLGDVNSLIGEFASAIDNYSRSVEINREEKIAALLQRKLALTYEKMGDFDASIKQADLGLEISKPDTPEAARLFTAKGWALLRKGQYDDAYSLLSRSLDIASQLNDQEIMGEAHHMIGSVLVRKGQYDDSLDNFVRAREIRESLGDRRGAAVTMNNMGVVFENRGELDKALENYNKALTIMKNVGDRRSEAMLYNNTGNIYFKLGQLDRAMENQQNGLDIRTAIGDKLGIEISHNNIGNIFFTRGEMEEAVFHYLDALKICEEIDDKRGMSMTLANVGIVYRQMGNHQKALEFHEKAIDQCQEIGYKQLLMELNHDMAMDWLVAGEPEKALEWSDKTEKMAGEMEVPVFHGKAHMARGIALGIQKDLEAAIGELETARTYLEEAGGSDLAEFRYEYGMLLSRIGKNSEAKNQLEQALKIFKEMGALFWIGKIENELEKL